MFCWGLQDLSGDIPEEVEKFLILGISGDCHQVSQVMVSVGMGSKKLFGRSGHGRQLLFSYDHSGHYQFTCKGYQASER